MQGYYTLNVKELAEQNRGKNKSHFPHQEEAFKKLTKTLPIPIKDYLGTLLVLPTGGGKTFTAVNWICRYVLPSKIKVLWLAQSSYLIDQAAQSFKEEVNIANERRIINLRIVSSSSAHANSGTININDDILVCTVQTAIRAYFDAPLDGCGEVTKTPFRRFIESCANTSLFIVIDEAHHTPAYGCRTLLISIKENIKNLYILGLTATPTHNDARISGWLDKIYDKGICYRADQHILQGQKILAVPKYREVNTNVPMAVDDALYDRLVYKHKDLPETIIGELVNKKERNDTIVSDYINNRKEYGKTIIFADRWPQCEYIAGKLNSSGIKAGAVFSTVAVGSGDAYRSGAGRRSDEENRKLIQDFRDNKLGVLVNISMLTEGIDVPDVKTVLITRQTTSPIRLTQMMGRALRGEKTGGGKDKQFANIVFFYDNWERDLPWARLVPLGDTEIDPPPKKGRNPMDLVSIHLVKLAIGDIHFQQYENFPYLTFIPVGFYICQYTVAVSENDIEEYISFEEHIIVYESDKEKYEKMIQSLIPDNIHLYADEKCDEDKVKPYAADLVGKFFSIESGSLDNFDGMLVDNIIKILRHMAQNGMPPQFFDFKEREKYDLDKLVGKLGSLSQNQVSIELVNVYNNDSMNWKIFYKNISDFNKAYYMTLNRVNNVNLINNTPQKVKGPEILPPHNGESTKKIRKAVFIRDNYTCQCCDKIYIYGTVLEIDHIKPDSMGGDYSLSNLQVLCKFCNSIKYTGQINFKENKSPLKESKNDLILYELQDGDTIDNILARIINMFYHCKAVQQLEYNLTYNKIRSRKYYNQWKIVIYPGNNLEWLATFKGKLLTYIQKHLGYSQVTRIDFTH
jgi:superfamily II DNA or RNA helicase